MQQWMQGMHPSPSSGYLPDEAMPMNEGIYEQTVLLETCDGLVYVSAIDVLLTPSSLARICRAGIREILVTYIRGCTCVPQFMGYDQAVDARLGELWKCRHCRFYYTSNHSVPQVAEDKGSWFVAEL